MAGGLQRALLATSQAFSEGLIQSQRNKLALELEAERDKKAEKNRVLQFKTALGVKSLESDSPEEHALGKAMLKEAGVLTPDAEKAYDALSQSKVGMSQAFRGEILKSLIAAGEIEAATTLEPLKGEAFSRALRTPGIEARPSRFEEEVVPITRTPSIAERLGALVKKKEPFTLGPGQVRFGPGGERIADVPGAAKVPTTRERKVGGKIVTEEFNPETGKWQPISEAPRFQEREPEFFGPTGELKPSVSGELRRQTAVFFEGIFTPTGEFKLTDPQQGPQYNQIVARGEELLRSREELSAASAIRRAARETGIPPFQRKPAELPKAEIPKAQTQTQRVQKTLSAIQSSTRLEDLGLTLSSVEVDKDLSNADKATLIKAIQDRIRELKK